jgi:hypothetical protein
MAEAKLKMNAPDFKESVALVADSLARAYSPQQRMMTDEANHCELLAHSFCGGGIVLVCPCGRECCCWKRSSELDCGNAAQT